MTEPSRRAPRSALAGVALWTVIGLMLLTAGFVAFALQTVESTNRRLQAAQDAQSTVISQLASGLDTTRKQLQQHHVKPKAPAASSIVQGVQGVPGVPGPAGPSGSPGAAGQAGAPGRNGSNGSPGAAGSPGPAGPTGAPGASVTGPPGPAGPSGAPGKDGATGPQGEQGPQGDRGPAGPPPSGWTFTYRDTTYECTPDSDGSTHYTCRDTSGGGSGGGGLLGLGLLGIGGIGLDPSRRQYI